jgi:protein-disulfide isomerase
VSLLKKNPDEKDHYIGDLNARVLLVEYGDYECPQSARSFNWTRPILGEYKNDLCFVFRHFPLGLIHPHSIIAAIAAESAALGNRFWEMHQELFQNHKHLSLELILKLSEKLKLKGVNSKDKNFKDRIMNHIIQDILSGEESGVTTTPSYFINGNRLEGIVNLDRILVSIEHILNGKGLCA